MSAHQQGVCVLGVPGCSEAAAAAAAAAGVGKLYKDIYNLFMRKRSLRINK